MNRREEMGMMDSRCEDHLRGVIADLERIKRLGVDSEAEEEIDSPIDRFRKTTG